MNPLSAIRTGLPYLNGNPGTMAAGAMMPPPRPPSVGELRDLPATSTPAPVGLRPSDGSFGSVLGRMIGEVNQRQVAAGQAVANLQSGGSVSLQQAMISMEEASVSFQLMAEVRNKLLESYQELMRMQV